MNIPYQSALMRQLVAEGDVKFLLARLKRHVPQIYHHSLRVAGLYEMLWEEADLPERTRVTALRSVLLHDVGCIHIPIEQLDQQYDKHTVFGIEILSQLIKEGRVDKDIVLYHHENLDGTGFPMGVLWNEQSAFVRTLRIVDDFDRWAGGIYTELSVSVAMDELFMWSDIQFDGVWLDRFQQMMLAKIQEEPQELDQLSRM